MNVREELLAQTTDLLNADAEELIAKLLSHAKAEPRNGSALIDARFKGSASYEMQACAYPKRFVRCMWRHCAGCMMHYYFSFAGFSIARVQASCAAERSHYSPTDLAEGGAYQPCDDKVHCTRGADHCFVNHGLSKFDPERLKGLAKVLYKRLTSAELGFEVKVEAFDGTFGFRVIWAK